MVIAIIILSIVALGLSLLLASSFHHIKVLRRELKGVSYVQHQHRQDIVNLVKHAHEVTHAVNEIADVINDKPSKTAIPYFGTIGKA